MSEIVLFSNNEKQIKTVQKYLKQHVVNVFQQKNEVLEYIKTKNPEVIIVDTVGMEDAVNVCRAVKFDSQTANIAIVLIVDKKQKNKDFLKYASAYVSKPIDKDILNSTLNSVLLTKQSLDELSETNYSLSTSLYRLDELNKTITALAGSLDKSKIIEIMTSGIEKFLSFQLCYSLVFIDPMDITLTINSLRPISPSLELGIKLRAIYSYKNLFNIHTTKEDIKVIKNIKRPNDVEYDANILVKSKFDTVFAPINVDNKFYGIIEVFREKEFNKNVDVIAFQTLVKQATFPLQSAILYEEIKEQNIKLEEMEKKKSEFFSIVSHELRTPLTAIQNAITILLSGNIADIPDRASFFIKMIERNSKKLFSIVQDWLDSAKADAGKLDYNFTVANINPIVDSVRQSVSNLADAKNIEFGTIQAENLPAIYIDTKRIEQVITNLVSNALKYTENGGKITITTSLIDAETLRDKPFSRNKDRILSDEYVVVKVSDTGVGIEKENIEKVFEKFEQVNGTLSRSVGGTGLGLYIAKQFADVHNGFLWLESVYKKGSDFYLAIPVLTEDERFEMQLRHDISNANNDKKNFGLITLCENKISGEPYLVEFIKKMDSENIFRKSTDSKYFYTETKENLYYSFYDVNMNLQIFNFVVQRILEYAKQDKILQSGKKIYLSQVCYPDDAGDAEELMKQAKKQLKEVING